MIVEPNAVLRRISHLGLASVPRVPLLTGPTPVEELPRLCAAVGGGPRLLVKRDDAIAFGGGGSKVRKLETVAAAARAEGADTLVTVGGVQSNHARVTAAVAARLGMRCVLVLNGTPDTRPGGNHLLMRLLGAEIEYVPSRDDRVSAMTAVVDRLRVSGRRPYAIPLGASTPRGAAGIALAVAEVAASGRAPDVIILATSSGGTQAGVIAGCQAFGIDADVIGVSVDDPADAIALAVRGIHDGMRTMFGDGSAQWDQDPRIQVDDAFVGDGYGISTEASLEALRLAARTEGLLLDPVYTAKAMAAVIAYVRGGRFTADQSVLFWHTGGVPGLFA